jgi:tetratricopeptide (TPR) repeat protein
MCALLALVCPLLGSAQLPLRRLQALNGGTNELIAAPIEAPTTSQEFEQRLEQIRAEHAKRSSFQTEESLEALLKTDAPAEIKRPAWLELAIISHQNKKFTKAQQIYSNYIRRYPKDTTTPEVLLRQGLLYREMGAYEMALAKFYAVMTVALHLKLDQMDYYRRIVLLAQTEIPETYYHAEKIAEAAELFDRLLRMEDKEINRPAIHLRLLRCLARMNRPADTISRAKDFINLYPGNSGEGEVRFLQAGALNELGQAPAAFEQVLLLLSLRPPKGGGDDNLSQWRQRAGNDVANRFYANGDYLPALELYRALAESNQSPAWQYPIWYQMGLVHERMGDVLQASALYEQILRQPPLAERDSDPALKIVLEMAKWRHKTLAWFNPATQTVKSLALQPSHP